MAFIDNSGQLGDFKLGNAQLGGPGSLSPSSGHLRTQTEHIIGSTVLVVSGGGGLVQN